MNRSLRWIALRSLINPTIILGSVVSVYTAAASAEPVVIRFEPASSVRLTDHDPAAPDILLYIENEYSGGGSGSYLWYPFVHGFDWLPLSTTSLLVESNIGPGLTSGKVNDYYFGGNYDELPPSSVISDAALGPWGIAHPYVLYGAPPSNYPLEVIASSYSMSSQDSYCFPCQTIFVDRPQISTVTPGINYIGFRWFDGPEVWYGWAAFRLDLMPYPPACRKDDFFCPPSIYDDARSLQIRFLAAAYESEPGIPIVVGGGLCRADMDYDAQIDFSDFLRFLYLFTAGDAQSDYNGDGQLTFIDFIGFIREFNERCDF